MQSLPRAPGAPCALATLSVRVPPDEGRPPSGAPLPPVRVFCPAGEVEPLRAELLALGVDAGAGELPDGAPPPPGARGLVAALRPEHEPWAYAYAATVGARWVPRGEWADAVRGADAAGAAGHVVLADLLETSHAELAEFGCLPSTPGYAGTGVVQVDGAGVGLRHLAKCLLAAAGAVPPRRGRLLVAPGLDTRAVLREGDDAYALGYVAAEPFAALLAEPRETLLLNTHSNPFDALLGPTAFCALAGEARPGAEPVPGEPGDRALPCFAGGGCVRALQSSSIQRYAPVSAVAARHVLWLGCDILLNRDSVYRSRRALFLQLLANPCTVSLTASASQVAADFDDLLAASFALDAPTSLGAVRDQVVRRGASSGAAPDLLLLGDPWLRTGGGEPAEPCSARVPARAGAAWTPDSLRAAVRLEGPGGGAGFCVPPAEGVRVYGVAEGGAGGRVLRLLAFGEDGAPAPRLSLAPPPDGDAGGWVGPCVRRLGFWRILLGGFLEKLERTHSSLADLHAQVREALERLDAWERDAARALASLRRPAGGRLGWTRAALARLERLRADAQGVQGALLGAVLAFAARVDPNLESRWLPSYVPVPAPGPAEEACACGARCDERWLEQPLSGARRAWTVCPRCGTVQDRDGCGGALRLRPAGHHDGLLAVDAEFSLPLGDVPVVLGATLRPEPGTGALLEVEAAELGDTPGVCRLLLRGDPGRVPSQQPLHLFAADSFALAHAVLWLDGAGPGAGPGADAGRGRARRAGAGVAA